MARARWSRPGRRAASARRLHRLLSLNRGIRPAGPISDRLIEVVLGAVAGAIIGFPLHEEARNGRRGVPWETRAQGSAANLANPACCGAGSFLLMKTRGSAGYDPCGNRTCKRMPLSQLVHEVSRSITKCALTPPVRQSQLCSRYTHKTCNCEERKACKSNFFATRYLWILFSYQVQVWPVCYPTSCVSKFV